MAIFLGIDCGATNLKIGLVEEAGELLALTQLPSPLKLEPEKLAIIIKQNVSILATKSQIDMSRVEDIGLGVPGPLDLINGLLLPSSNLGNVAPINLRIQFERVFNPNTFIDRDTVVALLGEIWKGGAKGMKDVVMLTLGTGVGGAIMMKGEIDKGSEGKAGELGHMLIQSEGEGILNKGFPVCGLGHRGCLEALINRARDASELGNSLGIGLANIVDIFNPEKIIIGGGKLKMGDFLPQAIKTMKQLGMKPAVDEVVVEYAKLKELSGVFGAARLAMIGGLK
jgi:glucokinase